jgi:hypothetical protein
MSGCARLHTDEATWKIGKEADQLGAPQLPSHQNGPVGADRMYLKDVLRQIQSDGGNLLLHMTTPRRGPTAAASLHSYACAGAVHAITSVTRQHEAEQALHESEQRAKDGLLAAIILLRPACYLPLRS